MIEATTISVSYSDHEDRMFIDCTDGVGSCRLLLTRRIAQRVLAGFADLLERSSPLLPQAPADMRDEVIAFEHLSAISQPLTLPPGHAAHPAAHGDLDTIMVAKIDVQVTPEAFRLSFHSADTMVVGLTTIRSDFHKTLALLDQCAAAAEWDIRGGTKWLGGDSQIVAAGRIAC